MRRTGNTFFLCLIVLVAISVIWVRPGRAEDNFLAYLDNVVRIEAKGESGPPDVGFGLIVGRSGSVLWVVTAAHVVFDSSDALRPVPRSDILVSWRNTTGKHSLASAPIRSANVDIAFLAVSAPLVGEPLDTWFQTVLGPPPTNGETVWLLGHDEQIGTSQAAGHIGAQQSEGSLKDTYSVEGLNGVGGQSGAPVISKNGIVGFYIGAAENGYIIPIAKIREVTPSNIPWSLKQANIVSGAAIHFCIKQIGPQTPKIKLSNPIPLELDGQGCVDAAAGKRTILLDNPDQVECSPEQITPKDPGEILAIECHPRTDGTWTTEGAGTLRVKRVAAGIWHFLGLEGSSLGRIEGDARGTADTKIVSASTYDHLVSLTGTMTVAAQNATLVLRRSDGSSITFQLER